MGEERAEAKPPVKKFVGVLRSDDQVVVRDPEAVGFLTSRGYGIEEGGVVFLSPVETLYLVYRGYMEVVDVDGNAWTFTKLLQRFSRLDKEVWVKLNLYSDLRRRGFIVRRGVGDAIEFFVDRRTKEGMKRYLVRGVKEGERLGFKDLEEMFRRALELSRELVLAVVDKEGNITYYTVEKAESVGRREGGEEGDSG